MSNSLFVRRPILASVLSIVIVLAGAVAGLSLPINQYPDIAPVQVTVTANYPGADAQTVADSVAAPIEAEVNGADNLLYMESTSTAAGQMSLTAYFELGTDPDTAEVQVNNRVNIALPSLPDAVQNTGVEVEKRSSSILMLISVYATDDRFDEQYVGNYTNLYVLDELKRVKGANQSQIMGLPDLAMRVWLNPERMASLGITSSDVGSAISTQNQQFSAGTIGQAPLATPSQLTVPMVTGGTYQDPAGFESIIVRAASEGSAVVRVGDVARAEVGIEQYLLEANVANAADPAGRPSSFIAVYQQPGANALAVADRVTELMESLKPAFPDGIDYAISFDTTEVISASIEEVVVTLIISVLLVVFVTYVFLQSVKATIIPTVAIVVAVVGTFAGMLVLGFSLNLLTMLGLVLAIGIVCDDAIVVVENVERVIAEEGLSAKDATIKSMGEVTGPVIATTLVLLAVYIPVAFLGGTTGVLYRQFAVTIAISVSISSFVALTLTPALCGVLLGPKGSIAAPFKAFNATLERITSIYAAGVKAVIRVWAVGLLLVAATVVGIVWLFGAIPGSFVPEEDQGYVFAAVIMPDGSTLDRTDAVTSEVTRVFAGHPAVRYASKISGYSFLDSQFKSNAGTVFVSLKDFAERKGNPELSLEKLLADVRPAFMGLDEGIAIAINPPSIPGLGNQGGFEFWVQNRGDDGPFFLAENLRSFMGQANGRPEISGVTSTYNASSRQIQIEIDRVRAETLGMPTDQIYDALGDLFGSSYVSQYTKFGRVWNVIVQADSRFRDDPEDIERVYVRQNEGEMIPLSAVVDASYGAGPDLVQRFNGFPAAKITGDAQAGFSSGEAIAAMEVTATDVLPDTMAYAWSGQAYEEKKTSSAVVGVFAFGIILVFLILAAQYEKWSLPLAIITAVPFGIFGALVSVYFAGMENDVYFQVGLITLIGLSAKNAILIVEFAQTKHESEGLSPGEAAIAAARLRLRPILMTSFSFILGSLPLVTASGAGAAARHSIGTGIIGGMIGATTLALFFVPMFYFLITSVTNKLTGKA
ncbi:MAG: multidrug efflux RND transporter permease subunit [Planctomycetota bacterium]